MKLNDEEKIRVKPKGGGAVFELIIDYQIMEQFAQLKPSLRFFNENYQLWQLQNFTWQLKIDDLKNH